VDSSRQTRRLELYRSSNSGNGGSHVVSGNVIVDCADQKGLVFFWIALFVCSIALQYAQLSRPSTVLAASGLKAQTIQGFEIDGDLLSGNASTNPGEVPDALINGPNPMVDGDDWLQGPGNDNVVSLPSTSTPTAFLFTDAVDPGDTSAYVGGNKEDDTRDWGYVNNAGPNPKTDFKHIMARPDEQRRDERLCVSRRRAPRQQRGDGRRLELNQKPFKQYSVGPLKPNRTNGDLLISLEYSNGGGNPIVTLYTFTNVQTFASGQTNDFAVVDDEDTIDAVRSATNFVDLDPSGFGYTVPAFDFAEASIDLSALGIETGCPGFSSGHIRSRTGGDPQSSQLKDAAPAFPIDLNTCGKVTIVKNAIPNDAQDFDFTTTGGAPLANFSLDNDGDDGNALSKTKTFDQVPPGGYTVTEASVNGWKLTDIQCDDGNSTGDTGTRKATINVGNNEHVTCTFTNTSSARSSSRSRRCRRLGGTFTFTGDAAGDLRTTARSWSTTCCPARTPPPRATRPRRSTSARSTATTATARATSGAGPRRSAWRQARPSSAPSPTSSAGPSQSSRTPSPTTRRTSCSPGSVASRSTMTMTPRCPTASPSRTSSPVPTASPRVT
jgi:hypothetical protein